MILSTCSLAATALLVGVSYAPLPGDGPYVLIRDQQRDEASTIASSRGLVVHRGAQGGLAGDAAAAGCDLVALGWHSQPAPDGGTLSPAAFMRAAAIAGAGKVAFMAQVDGAERNQGIFLADENGLTAIAMGCGGLAGSGTPAGCGDPTPIGGTFSGFFPDLFFTPATNDNGDVLFAADVYQGSSPRALFLYRADTQDIISIAAVGDAAPGGGSFQTIGPGSINNGRQIAFLASTQSGYTGDIYVWDNGALTRYVGVGDPAPGGGTFSNVATEYLGYADGTTIPVGRVPGINDKGQISFYAEVNNTFSGLLLSTNGQHEWMVRMGDPAPEGGTYTGFYAPLLNNNGQIAFFADVQHPEGDQMAWFAGSQGNWRRVITGLEDIDGGSVWGIAVSRNPISALDDAGDVVVWCERLFPDNSTRDCLVLSRADGSKEVIVDKGQPAAMGATFGNLQAWPSISSRGEITVSAQMISGPPGVYSAHMLLLPCSTGPDINGDGVVNVEDLLILIGAWGPCDDPGACAADLNGDQHVNVEDLLILVGAWG